jgi:hypothetical protein
LFGSFVDNTLKVVTKKDITPPNVYEETMTQISKILKSSAVRRMPVVVRSESDVEHGEEKLLHGGSDVEHSGLLLKWNSSKCYSPQ